MSIDVEFERFKTRLFAALDRFGHGLSGAEQAKFRTELAQLAANPELRASFVRSVFAN